MSRDLKITVWIERGVFCLVLAVLFLAIPFPAEARKLFYAVCGLAGAGWALDRKRPDNEVLMLMAALAVFALYRIIHTVLETGTFSPEADALQVYVSTANRFLMGLLLIGYVSTRQQFLRGYRFGLLCATLMISLVVVACDELILEQDWSWKYWNGRPQRATILAYEVVTVCFAYLGLQLMRQIENWTCWIAPTGISLLALGIVVWTGTRAALLCFFIGGALLLVFSNNAHKRRLLGVGSLLGAVMLACCYSDLIKPRLMEAQSDITQYVSGENRATSIGTRFELWRGSLIVLRQTPLLGGGYQKRAENISEAVEQQHLDPVAIHYTRVHMHNELLEELSLRGLLGGVLLLWVYSAIIVPGWRAAPRNLALLGVVFAYAFSGLTDVLFFSREATVLFMTLLAVLIRSMSRPNRL